MDPSALSPPDTGGIDAAGYRALFDSLDQGFCIVEMIEGDDGGYVDYRFVQTNAAFERESGLSGACGRTVLELRPETDRFWIDRYAEVLRSGEPARIVRQARSTGRWFETYTVRVDAARRRLAVLFRDITPARTAELRLRESEERLRLALEAAGLGTWEWDFRAQASPPASRSLRHAQIFGYETVPEAWSMAVLLEHVVEAHRPVVMAALERAGRDGVMSCEVQIRRADGQLRWVAPHGRVYYDEDGRPLRSAGVVADVTERKEAEEALRRSEERFRLMAESAPQIVWITDGDGGIEFLSRQWNAYTGEAESPSNAAEMIALCVHPDDRERTWVNFTEAGATCTTFRVEHRMRCSDGEYRWFLVRARPQLDPATMRVRHWYGASVDIHDRVLAEQRLAEADRRKDEFLAMLAHELRNPLAPISTAAQLLERLGADDARVRQVGAIVARQAAHMRSLIDDLLDVARVTQGRITLQREVLDVAALIAQAVEQARPQVESRGHVLDVDMADAPMRVLGDRVRLVQALTNLLDNAAKYTPAGGAIRVEAAPDGDDVRIAVRDSGVGIEPALLPTVFDLFVQGMRTPDRGHGGLGLGLALVRMLVQLHGGRVEATSDGPGHGSTFVMRLPRSIHAPAPLAPPPPRSPGAARRVCVVDDNRDAAETLGTLLRELGHDVSVHFAAEPALSAAGEDPRDVYILDIGLPGMDGHALVRRLRDMPQVSGARFIALTGYGQPADVERSHAAGFDDHVVKPIDVGRLLALLA